MLFCGECQLLSVRLCIADAVSAIRMQWSPLPCCRDQFCTLVSETGPVVNLHHDTGTAFASDLYFVKLGMSSGEHGVGCVINMTYARVPRDL